MPVGCVPYIVLSTGAYTLMEAVRRLKHIILSGPYLLRVNDALPLCGIRLRVDGAKEDGFELVHASIGEEKGWVG